MPTTSTAAQLVGVVAMVALVLICRWVFSPPTRRPPAPQQQDLGLLAPVVRVATSQDADALRRLLRESGIRAGTSAGGDGVDVLVFRDDLERARELVGSPG